MGDAVDIVLRIAGGLGLPALVLWFFSQRKRTNAEGSVAERTVAANVTKADASALETHVLAIERAMDVERRQKDRNIRALEEEVRQVEKRCDERVTEMEQRHAAEMREKDTTIGKLRAEVATLTAAVQELRSRLEA